MSDETFLPTASPTTPAPTPPPTPPPLSAPATAEPIAVPTASPASSTTSSTWPTDIGNTLSPLSPSSHAPTVDGATLPPAACPILAPTSAPPSVAPTASPLVPITVCLQADVAACGSDPCVNVPAVGPVCTWMDGLRGLPVGSAGTCESDGTLIAAFTTAPTVASLRADDVSRLRRRPQSRLGPASTMAAGRGS